MVVCYKRPYGSRGQVYKHNRTNGKRIRAYLCPTCKFWHATTMRVEGRHFKDARKEQET